MFVKENKVFIVFCLHKKNEKRRKMLRCFVVGERQKEKDR